MRLLLLGGISSHNKEWIEEIEESLRDLFDSTHIQYYDHWQSGGNIDVEKEVDNLIKDLDPKEDYVVFAKSAGVIVTLKAMQERPFIPKACIFVGSAIRFGRASGYPVDDWLKENKVRKLFIQQTGDNAIPFQELKLMLQGFNAQNYKMIEIPGNDHHYDDIKHLEGFIKEFLDK